MSYVLSQTGLKNLTKKQLGSFEIEDVFGNLTDICIRSLWSELVRKHNDPASRYHLSLYEYVVIGHELIMERDFMRINLSSLWMLANALRAIDAGWKFQLCLDVTSNFCSGSMDLLELLGAQLDQLTSVHMCMYLKHIQH